MSDLKRFREAHTHSYDTALSEIQNGCKISHWMWYIFPQIEGLGHSYMAQKYAIKDLKEARDYLNDEILGGHLRKISRALLLLDSNDPMEVMGDPDDLKLRSSMTLFPYASTKIPDKKLFQDVLDKYFEGKPDPLTLQILGE